MLELYMKVRYICYVTSMKQTAKEKSCYGNISCKLFHLKFCCWYIDIVPTTIIGSLSCLSCKMVGNPWSTKN